MNDSNGVWRGSTDATIAGLARGLDRVQRRLDVLPCHDCADALSSVKLLWKFVLVALAGLLALTSALLVVQRQEGPQEARQETQDRIGVMDRAER